MSFEADYGRAKYSPLAGEPGKSNKSDRQCNDVMRHDVR